MAVGARVTVANTATLVIGPDGLTGGTSHARYVIRNKGSVSVDLGGPAVASGQGFELAAGESISFDQEVGVLGSRMTGDSLYAITASGTCRLDLLEVAL